MSRANVDLFRRTVEAYNARDLEAFIAFFDPDVEFHSSFAGVGAIGAAAGSGSRRRTCWWRAGATA